ncbi:hypothetical protein ACFY5H_31880 [Streptomyces sp. NPDC013012]|uniref:hypothetical protein n=1 Tax=Streptomyces sp. NPDC013012 TaxID=3364860 RepID=UPI00368AB66D
MFTARAASSTTRIRRPAGPLPLLWLGALLLALLYTHTAGATAHITHGTTAAGLPLPSATSGTSHPHDDGGPDRHKDDRPSFHPAEACASGHPHQGCEAPAPPSSVLTELPPAFAPVPPQPAARAVPEGAIPWPRSLDGVVQQV